MPSLTELLDKPVREPDGEEVARLQDIVVRVAPAEETGKSPTVDLYPPVIGLVARLKGPRGASRDVFIPWERVSGMSGRGAILNSPALNLQRFTKRDGEIVLRGGLFDRQVVDVEGRRVVRINDLDLAERAGIWRLMAVDVSASALVRRLGGSGMESLGKRVANLLGREAGAKAPLIDWAMVVPVSEAGAGEEGALRLRVPRDRLAVLHPSDLAQLIEQLTPQQGADLLEGIDDERAADTLEELEDERQAQILRAMDPERAADVLEEMEPDEATDALQGISSEEMADLLGRMDREEAADVQELLGYPEDSAGGIMTTEYISVPEWATVGEVVLALRERNKAAAAEQEDPLPEALPELYIIAEDRPPQRPSARRNVAKLRSGAFRAPLAGADRRISLEAEGRLLGIVDLRSLLLADPEAHIPEIMRPATYVTHPYENERDVARIIADEDLLALPVVDDEGKMLGIVTVDDAIDVILPTAWKKRIPRRFR
ncbi:MAG TPA: CBS domain-containing protein [Ktedonobacterales bacterium]|nr:CBS domain-containing protein [Ktedonobacterales bacterium]